MKKLLLSTVAIIGLCTQAQAKFWESIPDAPDEINKVFQAADKTPVDLAANWVNSIELGTPTEAGITEYVESEIKSRANSPFYDAAHPQPPEEIRKEALDYKANIWPVYSWLNTAYSLHNYPDIRELNEFNKAYTFKIYKSATLRKLAYEWLKPTFQQLFASFEPIARKIPSDLLDHGIAYANKLRDPKAVACETKFLKAMTKPNGFDVMDSWGFSADAPKADCVTPDTTSPSRYRKLETWIYRRVTQNHITANEIVDLFTMAKKDFLPAN